MRYFALCLALAACGSADPITPDASQTPDAPIVDVADAAVDTAAPDATPDTATDAAVEASVDAASDANDAAVDAPSDVARDAGVDARSCGSTFVVECEINGHAECVNITTGRMQSDGTTLHCGACGVTCASGFACLARVCERL